MRRVFHKVNNSLVVAFLFILTYLSKAFTDAIYVSNEISSPLINIKYIFAILLIFYSLIVFIKSERKIYKGQKMLFSVLFVSFSFLVISLTKIIITGHPSMAVFEYLFKILIGIFVAFCVINLVEDDALFVSFVFILIGSIIAYLFEIGIENITLENIKKINFFNSYSPFESHLFASISVILCIYFCYFRKNIFLSIISLIFALATFKRLSVVFSLLFFVATTFFRKNKRISNKWSCFFALLFIILTCIYYYFLLPENQSKFESIFNIDSMTQFTMGRNLYFIQLFNSNYINFGIGSIQNAVGISLEMDLIEMLIESTPIGLAIFCFIYWKIPENKIYSTLFFFFLFLNMLMSHSLSNGLNWAVYFIVLFLLNISDSVEKRERKVHLK